MHVSENRPKIHIYWLCAGVWGGDGKVDVCGVCNGNGSSCATEEIFIATPNAVVSLSVDMGTNLTAVIQRMAEAIASDIASFSCKLYTDLTLAIDYNSISESNSAARQEFEVEFMVDVADHLGTRVDESDLTIISVQARSVILTFSVESTRGSIAAMAVLENALNGSRLAVVNVSSIGETKVAFAINSKKLGNSGTDMSTALPLLNTLIGSGDVSGIPPGQSVFQNLEMECPDGYYVDADGACSHCPAGEEPNPDKNGCPKCALRVQGSLQTWYSPIGAKCLLCPAGRYPNNERSDCYACEEFTSNDGRGELCQKCAVGKEPNNNHTACLDCPPNFFSIAGECIECEVGKYSLPQSNRGAIQCEICPTGRTGPQPGTGCILCSEGFYSLDANAACLPCEDLVQPPEELIKSIHVPDIARACPGGVPGVSAGICPQVSRAPVFYNAVRKLCLTVFTLLLSVWFHFTLR
jgi:hypothetical protein